MRPLQSFHTKTRNRPILKPSQTSSKERKPKKRIISISLVHAEPLKNYLEMFMLVGVIAKRIKNIQNLQDKYYLYKYTNVLHATFEPGFMHV